MAKATRTEGKRTHSADLSEFSGTKFKGEVRDSSVTSFEYESVDGKSTVSVEFDNKWNEDRTCGVVEVHDGKKEVTVIFNATVELLPGSRNRRYLLEMDRAEINGMNVFFTFGGDFIKTSPANVETANADVLGQRKIRETVEMINTLRDVERNPYVPEGKKDLKKAYLRYATFMSEMQAAL